MFCQVLANGCGHGKTQVRIDINLTDTVFACFKEHVFRYPLSSVKLAAITVAFFYEGGNDRGGSVKDQGEVWQQVGDFFKTGEVKFRLSFEFVGTMACPDGNGQGIDTRSFPPSTSGL